MEATAKSTILEDLPIINNNYLLLGLTEVDREDTWIEDMLQVTKKITEPIYRDLALKQLKCIAEIAA